MVREDAPFLTLEDVKSFLASCEDADDVGTPASVDSCLAAEALRWKYRKDQEYALRNVLVMGSNTMFHYAYYKDVLRRHEGYIDADVTPLLDTFDNLYRFQTLENRKCEPISKEELLSLASTFVDLLAEEVQV